MAHKTQTKFPTQADITCHSVAELRARIAEGKAIAARRLAEHATDAAQPQVSRIVCASLADRIRTEG